MPFPLYPLPASPACRFLAGHAGNSSVRLPTAPLPRHILGLALAGLVAGFGTQTCEAWQPLVTDSSISGPTLTNSHGVITVNMAAGDMNLQFNGAAIALNLDTQQGMGLASSEIAAQQRVLALRAAGPISASATINDNAFQNSSGLMSVNQASGIANAQANDFAMVLGFAGVAVSESVLEQNTTRTAPPTQEPRPARLREVSVADTSFRGAQGVAQVTQTAGSWNATTNSFTLRIGAGVNGIQP